YLHLVFFLSVSPPPPTSSLFPYTTLFRSTVVVFAIMLTERLVGERIVQTSRSLLNGAVVAGAVFVGVVGFLIRAPRSVLRPTLDADAIPAIGRALVGPFAVTLELLGLLLVVALLGALYFARTDE